MSSYRLTLIVVVAACLPMPAAGSPDATPLAKLSQRLEALSTTPARERERIRRALDAVRSTRGAPRRRALRAARARLDLAESRHRSNSLRATLTQVRARLVALQVEVAKQRKRWTERKAHLEALRTMR